MLSITVNSRGFDVAIAAFDRLSEPATMNKLLRIIGLTVEGQTIAHFNQAAGPDGPWEPTQRGGAILVATGRLRGSIGHVVSTDQVAIGTNVFYGKFHQYGTSRMVKRAFLGLTDADKTQLETIISDYVNGVISGRA